MSVSKLLSVCSSSVRVRVFDSFGALLYDSARDGRANYCVNIADVISFSADAEGLSITCDM